MSDICPRLEYSESIPTVNAATTLTGTIFVPAAPVIYNGTGNFNPSHIQLIGYAIELTGSNVTTVVYQDSDNWDANMPVRIGLMQ